MSDKPFQHIGELPCHCVALDIRRGDGALLVLRPCPGHSYKGIGWHHADLELKPFNRGEGLTVIDDVIRLIEQGRKFDALKGLLR